MAVNKVNYGDSTLIDLTGDTVTEETLAEGVKAHDASGTQITGKMKASGITVDSTPTENSQNAVSSDGVYKAIQALRKEILEEVLGNLTFRKSNTEPSVSTSENMITFVK